MILGICEPVFEFSHVFDPSSECPFAGVLCERRFFEGTPRDSGFFEHVEWDELGDCEFSEGIW